MGDPTYAMAAAGVVKAGASLLGGYAERGAQREQAAIARQQAARERARAFIDAGEYRRRASAAQGKARALRAASGVDVASGTPLAVDVEFTREGEFGAQTLLREGAMRAFRLEQEADIRERAGEKSVFAGFINAGTTALTAASAYRGWGSAGKSVGGAAKELARADEPFRFPYGGT